jgi:hypothetical protein
MMEKQLMFQTKHLLPATVARFTHPPLLLLLLLLMLPPPTRPHRQQNQQNQQKPSVHQLQTAFVLQLIWCTTRDLQKVIATTQFAHPRILTGAARRLLAALVSYRRRIMDYQNVVSGITFFLLWFLRSSTVSTVLITSYLLVLLSFLSFPTTDIDGTATPFALHFNLMEMCSCGEEPCTAGAICNRDGATMSDRCKCTPTLTTFCLQQKVAGVRQGDTAIQMKDDKCFASGDTSSKVQCCSDTTGCDEIFITDYLDKDCATAKTNSDGSTLTRHSSSWTTTVDSSDSTVERRVVNTCKDGIVPTPAWKCSSIADGDLCSTKDMEYNPDAADSNCAGQTCSNQVDSDVTTCCKNTPTSTVICASSNYPQDGACGTGLVYDTKFASSSPASIEMCCKVNTETIVAVVSTPSVTSTTTSQDTGYYYGASDDGDLYTGVIVCIVVGCLLAVVGVGISVIMCVTKPKPKGNTIVVVPVSNNGSNMTPQAVEIRSWNN